jgi:hypothetical protein
MTETHFTVILISSTWLHFLTSSSYPRTLWECIQCSEILWYRVCAVPRYLNRTIGEMVHFTSVKYQLWSSSACVAGSISVPPLQNATLFCGGKKLFPPPLKIPSPSFIDMQNSQVQVFNRQFGSASYFPFAVPKSCTIVTYVRRFSDVNLNVQNSII